MSAEPATYARRKLFNWSLRQDDMFENSLCAAMKMLPRGYGKLFLVRIAHLFLRDIQHDPQQMYRVMLDFVRDVRPMRVTITPAVSTPDVVHRAEPSHYHVTEAAQRPTSNTGNSVGADQDPNVAPPRQTALWHDDLASGLH